MQRGRRAGGLSEENDQLRHLLRQFQRMRYGRRSERLDPDQMQLVLEDTETAVAERAAQMDKTAAPDLTADRQQKKQRHTNRGALPAYLPRIHITVLPSTRSVPAAEVRCMSSGKIWPSGSTWFRRPRHTGWLAG